MPRSKAEIMELREEVKLLQDEIEERVQTLAAIATRLLEDLEGSTSWKPEHEAEGKDNRPTE